MTTMQVSLRLSAGSECYGMTNAGLNTTLRWVKYGQMLGQKNPVAGFVHIVPSAGLYLTHHFFRASKEHLGYWHICYKSFFHRMSVRETLLLSFLHVELINCMNTDITCYVNFHDIQ